MKLKLGLASKMSSLEIPVNQRPKWKVAFENPCDISAHLIQIFDQWLELNFHRGFAKKRYV